MFVGWQAFYQMSGGAAATLIGLLFLVVSLMSGRQVSSTSAGIRLFLSPTVFHLASVLVISALALAPDGAGSSRSVLMIAWAIFGVGCTTLVATRLRSAQDPAHWSDFWWYGAAPAAVYLALALSTAAVLLREPQAAYFVALCLLALLIVTIRNAWDLVTWLAPRAGGGER